MQQPSGSQLGTRQPQLGKWAQNAAFAPFTRAEHILGVHLHHISVLPKAKCSGGPKFRALSTRSDLRLWFVLQQVHPRMLQQSCCSSSCPAELVASYPQHHSQNPTGTAGICSLRHRQTRCRTHSRGATRQPCTLAACRMLQPWFSRWRKSARIFSGEQSHKELCRFTRG